MTVTADDNGASREEEGGEGTVTSMAKKLGACDDCRGRYVGCRCIPTSAGRRERALGRSCDVSLVTLCDEFVKPERGPRMRQTCVNESLMVLLIADLWCRHVKK